MVVLLIALFMFIVLQSIYLLFYRTQIKEIGEQMAFISKHHSFKLIQTQLKPKEISRLIDMCNAMLTTHRELNHQFIQKNEEIITTIVSLSHDIRTPLTSIDGYLQLAARTENSDEIKHYIKLAQSRMKRINRLVDELFLYTKLENKEYSLDLERIDIVNLLKQRLFMFIDEFLEKGYEPNISLPDAPVYIIGNSSAIERVIENIIKNYFIHGAGTMAIQYEEKEHEVNIYFTNEIKDGISINLDYIFTRFYKEDVSRTNHSTGLGLFIVETLMKMIRGDVTANIEKNRFCLSLVFKKSSKEDNHGESTTATNYINH